MSLLGKSVKGKRDSVQRFRWLAALSVGMLGLITVAAFVKSNPFSNPYKVSAVFANANQLKAGSEVRIAGFSVGQVSSISAGRHNLTIVTMALSGNALPLHTDATFTIKPRLALEGNGYIDVNAGSPAAPILRSGSTVPEAQTSVSVQIDQLLDLFDLPTRGALQRSVAALATGLGGGERSASTDSGVVVGPSAGEPGYVALKGAVRSLYRALPSVTTVTRAFQGTEPGDLTRAIGSSGDVAAQLAQSPQALAGIVTHYNTVFAALASQDRSLAETLSGFDAVMKAAPPSLTAIDAALPKLTSFANALRPTLGAIPPSLKVGNDLLDQFRATVEPGQLPTLVDDLHPIVADVPRAETQLRTMFGYSTPVTDCIVTHVVPTLDQVVPDGQHTTGDPAWLDLMHAFTGFSSFSSSVDANGGTVRLGITTSPLSVQDIVPGLGHVVGELDDAEGLDPTWLGLGVSPPYRPDQPCADQPLSNLGARAGKAPDWREEQVPSIRRGTATRGAGG